jgi:dGTP triphosphohydrolase
MPFVTIYTKQLRKRGSKVVQTVGCYYKTQSLTSLHESIRKQYPDAQTWQDPARVITDFVRGFNLGTLPIVTGGTRIA